MSRLPLFVFLRLSIFVIITAIPGTVAAQEKANNFHVVYGKLTWVRVFETDLRFDELVEAMALSGKFGDMQVSDHRILCHLRDTDIASFDAVLPEPSGNILNAFCIVEFKPGKYRVTLKETCKGRQPMAITWTTANPLTPLPCAVRAARCEPRLSPSGAAGSML